MAAVDQPTEVVGNRTAVGRDVFDEKKKACPLKKALQHCTAMQMRPTGEKRVAVAWGV